MSRPPRLVVFDVNETLSDLSPLAQRFVDLGLGEEAARTWFASVLRDGFALTVAGTQAPFAEIAGHALRVLLPAGTPDPAGAVEHVLTGFGALSVHPDVVDGVVALAEAGHRLVTLSNGATSVAEGLLERAGIRDRFEHLLSVEDAGVWKPAGPAYRYALGVCDVAAGDAMLVAVHPWDVDGAQRAGLTGVWLDRGGAEYPPHFGAPDIRVASLPSLAGVDG